MSRAEWWRGAVIYQIYPRSFFDSNADGIGDLPGVATKLDHVASLGVDAIWLGPFFASPQKDFGYDVAHHTEVDPVFGTLEDFDKLVRRAHTLGLKVLIDQVWTHTSDQHPWFTESRADRRNERADWYIWADPAPDGTPPNNWLSVFGGSAWTWDPRRRQVLPSQFPNTSTQAEFTQSGRNGSIACKRRILAAARRRRLPARRDRFPAPGPTSSQQPCRAPSGRDARKTIWIAASRARHAATGRVRSDGADPGVDGPLSGGGDIGRGFELARRVGARGRLHRGRSASSHGVHSAAAPGGLRLADNSAIARRGRRHRGGRMGLLVI